MSYCRRIVCVNGARKRLAVYICLCDFHEFIHTIAQWSFQTVYVLYVLIFIYRVVPFLVVRYLWVFIYLSLWMKDEVLAERMDGRMYGTEAHHISAQDWTQNTSVCVGKRYINIHTYVYIYIHVANDD